MRAFARTALVAVALLAVVPLFADPEYPKMGVDIYDVHADAKADIATALAAAKAEHKWVIVDFGANWCIWCHRLHDTFENNPEVSKALRKNYIVVMVDVNTRNGTKRNSETVSQMGDPTAHGIPVLVLLDWNGKQLTTKDTGELEDGPGHSPAKILAFLDLWTPPGR